MPLHKATANSLNCAYIRLGLSLDDNPFPDATPAFFEDYGRVLSNALDHPLQVLAPYRNRHKSQVIAEFAHLPLELTLTCMQPGRSRWESGSMPTTSTSTTLNGSRASR